MKKYVKRTSSLRKQTCSRVAVRLINDQYSLNDVIVNRILRGLKPQLRREVSRVILAYQNVPDSMGTHHVNGSAGADLFPYLLKQELKCADSAESAPTGSDTVLHFVSFRSVGKSANFTLGNYDSRAEKIIVEATQFGCGIHGVFEDDFFEPSQSEISRTVMAKGE